MSAHSPFVEPSGTPRAELAELAVPLRKLRAGEPLTEAERELVNLHGQWLLDLSDGPAGASEEGAELQPEEEERLLEALVVGEDDLQAGNSVPWREYFASRGVPVPPG